MSEDEQGYAPAAYLEPMEAVGKEQLMESGGSCEGEGVRYMTVCL